MHEIFLNEKISQSNKTLTDKDINIHSISMIKKRFGKNYDIKVKRTFYPNWEKKIEFQQFYTLKRFNYYLKRRGWDSNPRIVSY